MTLKLRVGFLDDEYDVIDDEKNEISMVHKGRSNRSKLGKGQIFFIRVLNSNCFQLEYFFFDSMMICILLRKKNNKKRRKQKSYVLSSTTTSYGNCY